MTNVYVKPNHSVAHPLLISYFFALIVIYLLTLSTADEIAVSNDSCKNRVEKVYFLDTIYRCYFFILPILMLSEATTKGFFYTLPSLTSSSLTTEIINLPLSRAKEVRIETRCVLEDIKYDHAKISSTDN